MVINKITIKSFGHLSGLTLDFSDFSDKLTALGKGSGLDVHVMHEDIFNSMHNI